MAGKATRINETDTYDPFTARGLTKGGETETEAPAPISNETDRAPVEERAYDEGLAAGKLRKDNANPYGADSVAGQNWQRGFNDGTAFANKDLAAQFEGEGGDELIQGSRGDDPFEDANELEAAE